MITEALLHELKNRDLSLEDFKRVVLRLLDRQVIYRRESNVETEIYDLYFRMESLVAEYLNIIGIRVVNHTDLSYVIAYPPGSSIPGVYTEDEGDNALQRRIRNEEAGLLITFRLLYEEKIREGEIDENGCVYVSLETVFTRYHSIVKREMPSSETERKTLFSTLRQFRIIEYNDLSTPDQWIGIREVILHFTLEGVLNALDEMDSKEDDAFEFQSEEE
ncbi:MAG: DUF4194 domain-containing protein [Proteobacteria bacterium]|nr:DUF4194 domain-containing protein [Pseudomonadota bacterium]